MTKTVLVIGIGPGDPDQITIQALDALRRADALFILDKGAAKRDLTALRREICRRHMPDRVHRIVEAPMPERRRDEPDYGAAVAALNEAKAALFQRLIETLAPGESGAFLVWGDPAIYDSTIANLQSLLAADAGAFALEVIPGISSLQALAAKHRTTLTTIGAPLTVTTGRRLAGGLPDTMGTVAVMLDADGAYRRLAGEAMDIHWGAYVGMEGELLRAGEVGEVAEEITTLRERARAARGWIMDSYILRPRRPG